MTTLHTGDIYIRSQCLNCGSFTARLESLADWYAYVKVCDGCGVTDRRAVLDCAEVSRLGERAAWRPWTPDWVPEA